MKNPSGNYYDCGEPFGLIQPAQSWRALGRRLVLGLCLVSFSALVFIGAFTVIGWIV